MNAILTFLLRLLLILLSYSFIGWMLYTIYKDIRNSLQQEKSVDIPPLILTAEINGERNVKYFTIPEFVIGRDPSIAYPLEHETISSRHCKIFYLNKQWWAEDLQSTNGSFLNEIMIETPIVLTAGDILRLGRINLSIQINDVDRRDE